MKKIILSLSLLSCFYFYGQVKIGDSPNQINSNSLLELESENKVLVVSRISNSTMETLTPLNGAIVYNTDEKCLFQFNDNSWNSLCNNITNETLTALIDNNDGTLTYIDEQGNTNTINISEKQTLTAISLNIDNTHIDYLDENGNTTQLNLTSIIKNLETATSIVNNSDGSFSFTNESGETITISGKSLETLTSIALNSNNTSLDYTDENGETTQLDFTNLVKNLETLSTLVTNNDGTLTYTNEAGNTTTINIKELETLTNIALNPDNINIDYVDENNVTTQLNLTDVVKNLETLTSIVENNNGTFSYQDEHGNITSIDVTNLETLTSIALNANNKTLNYTDENGQVSKLDFTNLVKNLESISSLIQNSNGTFTYTNEKNETTIIDVKQLETLTSIALNTDNTNIDYTDESGNSTQLNLTNIIKNLETLTTISENNNGTFTYINEKGESTTIDVSNLETLTTIALNADNINIDYTDENGTTTQINLTNVVKNLETITSLVNNNNGTFTYTNEANVSQTISARNFETLTNIALNPDNTHIDYTDENGTITQLNLTNLVNNLETASSIALNGDNVNIDFTDEKGVVTKLNLSDIVKNLESTSGLIDNNDGTFTYTNEDEIAITIDMKGAFSSNGDGVYTFKDAAGTETVIDISNRVLTVNGVSPDSNGNVSVILSKVSTGPESDRPTTNVEDADIYIVSGDPNPQNNGITFIYDDITGWNQVTTDFAINDQRYVNVSGDTMEGALNMNGFGISNLPTPSNSNDAAPKGYVDTIKLTDNGDGTVTLTRADNTQDTFNKAKLIANTNGTYTFDNGNGVPITINVKELETLTSIAINADNTNIDYTDENGDTSQINLTSLVKNLETLTTLVNNNNGSFSYTNEKNQTTTINIGDLETLTAIALNPNNTTIDYTDENGNTTNLNLTNIVKNLETVTSISENTNGTFTFTDEKGDSKNIDISNLETLTSLILNGDNTNLDYTDESGTTNKINLSNAIKNLETLSTLVKNADGTFTYTNENNITTTLDITEAETLTSIALNEDNINIDYTDENGTTTKLNLTSLVKNLETTSTIIENANGTFTYTDEKGQETDINISNLETLTSLSLNPDNTNLDFTDENGTVNKINLTTAIKNLETVSTLVSNSDGTFRYTDEKGETTDININDLQTLTTIAINTDDTHIDYKDENGNETKLDLTDIVKNLETLTSVVENSNGTFTFKNEDGQTTNIDVKNLETLTKISLNGDNTNLDYVDEDGITTKLNLTNLVKTLETTTNLSISGSVLSYKDEDGTITTIDINQIAGDGTISSNDLNVVGGVGATNNNVTLEIKAGAVGTTELANDAVDKSKINEDIAGTGLKQNTDGSLEIDPTAVTADGDITSSDLTVTGGTDAALNDVTLEIKAGAVGTTELADDAVTNTKIADNAVESDQIKNGTIATTDIADNAVDKSKINEDIAGTGLKQNTDGSLEIDPTAVTADGDITSSDLTVTGGTDAALNDVTLEIKAGAVGTTELADDAVTNTKIADNAVESDQIKNGTITTTDIADNAIDKSKINEDIAGTGLKQNTDGSLEIDPSAVTADGDITSSDLTVTGGTDAALNDVTLEIKAGAVGTTELADDAVDKSKINEDIAGTGLKQNTNGSLEIDPTAVTADGDITSSDLTVTGGTDAALNDVTLEIKAGAVGTTELANDAVDKSKINEDIAGTGLKQNTDGSLEIDPTAVTADGDITSSDLTVTGGTDAALNDVTLEIKAGAVGTTELADDAVDKSKINPDVAGTGLKQNTDGSLEIDPSAVTADGDITSSDLTVTGGTDAALNDVTLEIKAGAVGTTELANSAVTTAKVADNAIETTKIKDGNVTSDKIAADAIDKSKINPDVAGTGLTQNADGSLEIDPTTVTADGDITSSDLTVTGGTDAALNDVTLEIKAGAVGTTELANSAVTTAKVADNAIETTKIKDGNVTSDKIAADAIDKSKINPDVAGTGLTQNADGSLEINPTTITADGDITSSDLTVTGGTDAALNDVALEIKAGAVGTTELANSAVTTAKVADNAIETTKIKDGNVTSDKIAADAIDKSKINPDVAGTGLTQNTDGSLEIDPTTVTADGDITSSDLTVTGGTDAALNDVTLEIKAGAVGTTELANSAVTTAKVADNAIETTKIKDGNVTSDKIAADAIDKSKINPDVAGTGLTQNADGSLEINPTTITADGDITSSDLTVTGGTDAALNDVTLEIKAGAVGTTELANSAVTTAKVADNAIETTKIKDGNVTSDKIAADAIDKSKINPDVAGTGLTQNADGSLEINPTTITADGDITSSDLTVTGGTDAALNDVTLEIKAGAVGTTELANSAVTTAKVADNAIETTKIKDGNVTSDKIAADAIDKSKINPDVAGTGLTQNTDGSLEIDTSVINGSETKVTGAGINVVTGSGTTASPYVVTATEVDGSITNEIGEYTDSTTGTKHKIGEYKSSSTATAVDVNETVTTLSQNTSTGIITYTNEGNSEQKANIVSTDTNNQIKVGTDGGAFFESPVKAIGKVNANGSAAKIRNATVEKIGTGRYRVTLTPTMADANYVIQLTVKDSAGAGNDDYDISYNTQTASSFIVEIGDNDNGGSDRANRDFEFMFTVLDF